MARYHKIEGKRVKYTQSEETARDAEEKAWVDGAFDRKIAQLRLDRNHKLAESDWIGLSDSALTSEVSAKWKLYRQKLRDLPTGLDTEEKVKNVTWPTKPE